MTGSNKAPESGEQKPNTPKADSSNLYSRLLKNFVGEKMKNKPERLAFAKEVQKNPQISPELLEEIKKFAGKKPEFDGLEITAEKVQASSLKREIAAYLATIQRKKSQIRDLFLQEYSIEPKQYTDTLSPDIENLQTEMELDTLISSSDQRRKLLKKVFSQNPPLHRDMFEFLSGFDLEKKYKTLSGSQKESFYMTIQKMQKQQKLSVEDVWELFDSGVFSLAEKQRILETFVPTMSLKKALDIGIFGRSEAEEFKRELLKKTVDSSLFSSPSELDEYISQIADEDIVFSTQGFFWNKGQQEKLIESNFFVNEFLSQYHTMIQSIQSTMEQRSIQTASEMIHELEKTEKFKNAGILGLSLFAVGSTMIIHQSISGPNGIKQETPVFAEISSLSDKGYLTLTEKGSASYDRDLNKVSRITYSDFVQYVSQTGPDAPNTVEIVSATELKRRIIQKEVHDVSGILPLTDKSEVKGEIAHLTEKIEARKKELQDAGMSKEGRSQDATLKSLYAQRDAQNVSINSLDALNLEALNKKIGEIDAQGESFGLEKGVTFEVTRGKNKDAYTIVHIDEINQNISIKGVGDQIEIISYRDFAHNFEQQRAKRVSNIKNFDALFIQPDKAYEKWTPYELKEGFIKKKGLKGKHNFNFLVPPDGEGDELLKIHSVDGDSVTVSFGKVKDIKEEAHHAGHGKHGHHEEKKAGKKQSFLVDSNTYTLSLGVLDSHIRNWKLTPKTTEDGKVQEEEAAQAPNIAPQFHFMSWFFSGISVAEIMKGGHMFLEQYTKIMEEGQEHKAGHFALHTLGRFLPKESLIDLQSRIEAHEKHEMDEHLERLNGINSKLAVQVIEEWLLDPYCPENKKEAGLMYMMKKYGALCAKGALYPYKGQYLWYRALGGSINPPDSNFLETKAANDKLGVNTTEEELVYWLIKKQTTNDHGYNGVHRRSKLDKELKAVRGQGKLDEIEVGKKDGAAERDVMERVKGAKGELESGNYPNTIGWLEMVVQKGGPMHVMNEVPFVMMFSGMAYDFEKDMTDKLKNFPASSMLLPMLRFISYQRDIALVNDTIMEICKRLEKKGGSFSGIASAAGKIYKNQRDTSIQEKDKQKATIEFYNSHNGLWGKTLTDILYMLNTGGDEDTLNKMIFLEKDNQLDENGKEIPGTGNEVFQRYYDQLHGYLRADGDFGKDEGLMADSFAQAGTSGMDMYRAVSQLFMMKTGGVPAKGDAFSHMWTEVRKEFEAIPKRKYDANPVKNKKIQQKILEENLRFMIAGIMERHADNRTLAYFNAPNAPTNKLNDWGIYLNDFLSEGANKDSILAGGHSDIIHRFVKQIMDVENGGKNYKRPVRTLPNGGYEFVTEASPNQTGIGDLVGQKVGNIVSGGISPQARNIIEKAQRGAAAQSYNPQDEDEYA